MRISTQDIYVYMSILYVLKLIKKTKFLNNKGRWMVMMMFIFKFDLVLLLSLLPLYFE